MKYCSVCGSLTERKIPEGDNRERDCCENCGTIHYSNPKIIVGTVPFQDSSVLLCKRGIEPRYGKWTLPGGFLENGESIEEGAVRETYEEALLKVENVNLFTILSVPHINQIYTFFTGEINGSSFGPTPESSEVKLFKIDEIPWDELAFPTVKRTLQLFLEEDRNNVFNEVLKY